MISMAHLEPKTKIVYHLKRALENQIAWEKGSYKIKIIWDNREAIVTLYVKNFIKKKTMELAFLRSELSSLITSRKIDQLNQKVARDLQRLEILKDDSLN